MESHKRDQNAALVLNYNLSQPFYYGQSQWNTLTFVNWQFRVHYCGFYVLYVLCILSLVVQIILLQYITHYVTHYINVIIIKLIS